MSVTFQLEGSRTAHVACPKCGACYPKCLDNNCEAIHEVAGRCYGMGFAIPSGPELNLANGNAAMLLDAMRVSTEDLCGTLEPQEVLNALAVIESNGNRSLVRGTFDNGGFHVDENGVGACVRVISFGVNAHRAERYVESLRKIAQAALAQGVRITYG
jgi:hypothetical protein